MDHDYQLEQWSTSFGNEYTERNAFEEWKLKPGMEAFKRILGNIEIDSLLEVGSNIGLNLIYINELMHDSVVLYAVEPNEKAFEI